MKTVSSRDTLIELVTQLILKTALRVDLEHQRLPQPAEFATDIVNYLYGVADAESKKEKENTSKQDSSEGVRGGLEEGHNGT